jgi:monovalent cation:H+ antiporter-2, CPA2 family
LSLTQIGEFSFIIAGVGISTGAAGSFLYTVAVAVSAITTFTTAFMIRACEPVGRLIETRVPRALDICSKSMTDGSSE